MKHITIVDGHPDPSESRLVHALANRYAEAARAAGNEVRRIDVARMDFPLLRDPDDFYEGQPPKAIRQAQRDIVWADHLAFFYPLWNGDMPALLKAFIEQTFRPGFAMEYGGARRFPKRLLTGRSARVVVTMGMPAFIYRSLFGAHALKNLKTTILRLCGIAPVYDTLIGDVDEAGEARRQRWLERMAAIAQCDGARIEHRPGTPARVLFAACAVACAAYAGYAAAAWSRYGRAKGPSGDDPLLDRVMPDYEVRAHYETEVGAPAEVTFDAIHHTDFERSPIIRALFRGREILLGATHAVRPMPHALLDQVAALGWSVVAQESGRELVLATVTQPWQANPTFHGLPVEAFTRFNEPGYAKIAFTLRVDPLDALSCKAQTETRVQTTDPISRARFRRYWALLSPGIALIRLVLLQQVKTEAEARWKRERVTSELVHHHTLHEH